MEIAYMQGKYHIDDWSYEHKGPTFGDGVRRETYFYSFPARNVPEIRIKCMLNMYDTGFWDLIHIGDCHGSAIFSTSQYGTFSREGEKTFILNNYLNQKFRATINNDKKEIVFEAI